MRTPRILLSALLLTALALPAAQASVVADTEPEETWCIGEVVLCRDLGDKCDTTTRAFAFNNPDNDKSCTRIGGHTILVSDDSCVPGNEPNGAWWLYCIAWDCIDAYMLGHNCQIHDMTE